MTRKAPGTEFSLLDLSQNSKLRHEQFVDLFGQYLFWMRNSAVERSKMLIEDEERRSRMGTIARDRFDSVADLAPESRGAAVLLAEATVDEFCDQLLRFLGNEGFDLRVGSGQALQVLLEIVFVEPESGSVVASEVVNRGGKSMPDYWGRWLNRHKDK